MELVEAQRIEAAEARVAAEISRRAIQQKARKAERVSAHQKYTARVLSKGLLQGLRETTLQQISDLNLMPAKIECQI